MRATWMHLMFECMHADIVGAREDYMDGLQSCLRCVDDDAGESWTEVLRLALAFERHFVNRVPWPAGSSFADLHPAGADSEKGYRRVVGGLIAAPKLALGRSLAGSVEAARRAAGLGADLAAAGVRVARPLERAAHEAARARYLARRWVGVWVFRTWGRGPAWVEYLRGAVAAGSGGLRGPRRDRRGGHWVGGGDACYLEGG